MPSRLPLRFIISKKRPLFLFWRSSSEGQNRIKPCRKAQCVITPESRMCLSCAPESHFLSSLTKQLAQIPLNRHFPVVSLGRKFIWMLKCLNCNLVHYIVATRAPNHQCIQPRPAAVSCALTRWLVKWQNTFIREVLNFWRSSVVT